MAEAEAVLPNGIVKVAEEVLENGDVIEAPADAEPIESLAGFDDAAPPDLPSDNVPNGDEADPADAADVAADHAPSGEDTIPDADVDALREEGPEAAAGSDGILPAVPPPGASIPFVQAAPLKRNFFVVRVPRPDLGELIARIKAADLKVKEKVEKMQQLSAAVRAKQATRSEAVAAFKEAKARAIACSKEVSKKYDEVRPIQELLRKIQDASSAARNRSRELSCSSEEQLNKKIAEIEHRMEHESLSLQQEKQLMKELKQLEASRGGVKETEAMLGAVTDSQGQKEALQARLKPLLAEVAVLKLERDAADAIRKSCEDEANAFDEAVDELKAAQEAAWREKESAYAELRALRAEANKRDEDFKAFSAELARAQELAANKDVAGLEAFCTKQVERIHAKLAASREYRVAYFKANERSTIRRFRSLDTRRLGLDEDPSKAALSISSSSAQQAAAAAIGVASGAAAAALEGKGSKAAAAAVAKGESGVAAKKEAGGGEGKKAAGVKSAGAVGGKAAPKKEAEGSAAAGLDFEYAPLVVSKREGGEGEDGVAAKEKKREEELKKAKEAEERKKRLAEKNAARASAKAAKEAEEAAKRKEKEKERKARRKAAQAAAAAEKDENANDGDEAGTGEGSASDDAGHEARGQRSGDEDGGKSELTRRQRKRQAAAAKGKDKAADAETKGPVKVALKKRKEGGGKSWIFAVIGVLLVALLGAAAVFFLKGQAA